jgi:4-hydroxy-tetrahydrodipicolinate synthase
MSKPYDRELLRTVHMVPLTALDSSGGLNLQAQSALISRLYAAGMRVFLPAAGTGEFHSLSADEIVEIVRVTRDASGSDAQIFAPVGMQIGEAIDVARRSIDAGATGIMFMPLVHPYISDSGARDYYLEVIRSVARPTLVYKKVPVPSNALLLELADNPHVVGVKYAINELHEFRKTVLADRGRIEWLCGSAEKFAPYYMLAGSTGYTTGAGNLCPHLTLAMHAAFSAGEWEEGMRLQKILLPIEDYRAREGDSYNVSMLKQAVRLLGEDLGPVRPPQRKLTAAEAADIETLMKPILAAERALEQELAGRRPGEDVNRSRVCI